MFSEELEKIDWEETTKAIYSKTESDVQPDYCLSLYCRP